MIQAFTFETKIDDLTKTQVRPYDAKIDARIRRDLFHGFGNIVFVGDRNGYVEDSTTSQQFIGDIVANRSMKIKFNSSVTFSAGGRLFTLTDELITLTVETKGRDVIGSFVADINTNDNNEQFIQIVSVASYSDDPESWETDTFSATFSFVIRPNGRSVHIYPVPWQNAQVCAGSTFMLGDNSENMNGSENYTRKGLVTDTGLLLAQDRDIFTISGTTNKLRRQNDTLCFGEKYGGIQLSINEGDGSVVIFTEKGIFEGSLSTSASHQFVLSNIRNIKGDYTTLTNGRTYNANVLGNFTATWN